MRNLKTYEKFNSVDLLQTEFEKYLPQKIEVIKEIEGQVLHRQFMLGNIMRNANMTQIIYSADEQIYGHPDEMSVDIYYLQNGNIKLDIDIVYGDTVTCEFSCQPPDDVELIQYTSVGSRWDPSDTIFALSNETIADFVKFINMIEGFMVDVRDFYFLTKR